MAITDVLAWWGACLSTLIAIREWAKHRTATRPKLAGFLESGTGDGMLATAGGPGQSHTSTGETRFVIVHNRGGVGTTIYKAHFCVASRFCPRFMLGLLGQFGWAPTRSRSEDMALYLRPFVTELASGKEEKVRSVLWDEDREALKRGRLMLQVVHTWSRDRPQQILLRQAH